MSPRLSRAAGKNRRDTIPQESQNRKTGKRSNTGARAQVPPKERAERSLHLYWLGVYEGKLITPRSSSSSRKRKIEMTDPDVSASEGEANEPSTSTARNHQTNGSPSPSKSPDPKEHSEKETKSKRAHASKMPKKHRPPNKKITLKLNNDMPMQAEPIQEQQKADVPPNPTAVDFESFSQTSNDVDRKRTKQNLTADIYHFFEGQVCKLCREAKARKIIFSQDTLVRRRHLESFHKGDYHIWADKAGFQSMLPDDIKQRRQSNEQRAMRPRSSVTSSNAEQFSSSSSRIVKLYTATNFNNAVASWVVQTDQPLSATEHPSFRAMISIATSIRPEDLPLTIPNTRMNRQTIISGFNQYLQDLKQQFNDNHVGLVSLTCDSWKSISVDSYFAVTAHWSDIVNNTRAHRSALIGFAQMNKSHTGDRLGECLFELCDRVGLIPKVGWVTCDNIGKNDTMMDRFARLVKSSRSEYDGKEHRMHCISHCINLAVQAVIRTQSKTKHQNAHDINDPDLTRQDFVGIIRVISAKIMSSSQRKDMFDEIQRAKLNIKEPKRPIVDMAVRWSSTYEMLNRAIELRKAIDQFVLELMLQEKNAKLNERLTLLQLSDDDWQRIELFRELLKYADDAQRPFSLGNYSTIAYAVSTLEWLSHEWKSLRENTKYGYFHDALTNGLTTIEKYYRLITEKQAYTVCMVLRPKNKLEHFSYHWSTDRQEKVMNNLKEIFKARYIQLYGDLSSTPKKDWNLDEDKIFSRFNRKNKNKSTSSGDDPSHIGSTRYENNKNLAWEKEFDMYLYTDSDLPEDAENILQWWHKSRYRYPTWFSLAMDYLPIMASSVPSERVFSSAGLTVTKRRTRLKSDVMEALQVMKFKLKQERILLAQGWSSASEGEFLDSEQDAADDVLTDDLEMSEYCNTTVKVLLDSDCEEEEMEHSTMDIEVSS